MRFKVWGFEFWVVIPSPSIKTTHHPDVVLEYTGHRVSLHGGQPQLAVTLKTEPRRNLYMLEATALTLEPPSPKH